jgi:hypothetical protein
MGKSIVFISAAIHFVKYQHLIAKKLKEKGVNVSYVTFSKEDEIFLKKRNELVDYIPSMIKRYKLVRSTQSYLDEIEKKYNINTNLILFADYDHSKMKREKAMRLMIKHFMFWENYIKKKKANIIVGSSERFAGVIPYLVCKYHSTDYYFWTRSVIAGNYVLSECPADGHLSILNAYWEKNKDRTLSETESQDAQTVVDSITRKKKTLYLVVGTPTIKMSDILFFFKRFFLNIYIEKFNNPYARVCSIAWNNTKKAFRKHFVRFLYSKPELKKKYFFYPLHLDEDAQIILRAPHFADQIPLIHYIAKSIPSGYTLYVKEHPNNIGGTSIRRLKEIQKIPNVELISPYFSSHDLTKNSKGIITINSTVGWEAILYQKPVIVLGTCFYDISGLVWKVRDLYELPSAVRLSLKTSIITKEKLLRFVNAVANTDYPGDLNFYYQFAKKNMNERNIQNISDGLYDVLLKH